MPQPPTGTDDQTPTSVAAVVGPTASGKSDLALDLALRLGGEVVNADAMQLYRGMDIGTAKLPLDERRGVAHHQLDVLDVQQEASVAAYQRESRADLAAIRGRGHVPLLVGGSGLYVRAALDRLEIPPTDPAVRAALEAELEQAGVEVLRKRLTALDPQAANAIQANNGRRIVRALEVVELTGQPFAASAPTIGEPRWDTAIIGLDWDTERLDERLRRRTDVMFDDGLVDEVTALRERGLREGVTASRALGYAQVLEALADGGGDAEIAEARERTFIGTRRYVRRQRSWFRRDHRTHWLDGSDPGNVDAVLRICQHVS